MHSLRIFATGLTLLVSLASCQEQPQPVTTTSPTTTTKPVAQQYRLKRTIQESNQQSTTFSYNYNTAGQLSDYTIRAGNATNAAQQTTVFRYDTQGRLTSAERLPAASFMTGRLTYEYDATGNLTLIKLYEDVNQNGQFALTRTTTLTYGIDKAPLTITIAQGNRMETTRYTYQNGNAIRTERSVSPGNEPAQTVLYQHDDKPNPTYGLVLGSLSPEIFNRNNILYDNSERTYNSNGLLTDLYTNVKESPNLRSHIIYEYEAY